MTYTLTEYLASATMLDTHGVRGVGMRVSVFSHAVRVACCFCVGRGRTYVFVNGSGFDCMKKAACRHCNGLGWIVNPNGWAILRAVERLPGVEFPAEADVKPQTAQAHRTPTVSPSRPSNPSTWTDA